MHSAIAFGAGYFVGYFVYFACVHKPAVRKLESEMSLLYRFVRDHIK